MSPVISVDKNQLKQAFLNLFINAIQAMPNGGTLTVSIVQSNTSSPKSPIGDQPSLDSRQKRCGNDNVLITISDTGCGIPKDQLNHIFDPFFSTKDGGTGLGLSIVHGIIEKHGGSIKVGSENFKGATISVLLKNQS